MIALVDELENKNKQIVKQKTKGEAQAPRPTKLFDDSFY